MNVLKDINNKVNPAAAYTTSSTVAATERGEYQGKTESVVLDFGNAIKGIKAVGSGSKWLNDPQTNLHGRINEIAQSAHDAVESVTVDEVKEREAVKYGDLSRMFDAAKGKGTFAVGFDKGEVQKYIGDEIMPKVMEALDKFASEKVEPLQELSKDLAETGVKYQKLQNIKGDLERIRKKVSGIKVDNKNDYIDLLALMDVVDRGTKLVQAIAGGKDIVAAAAELSDEANIAANINVNKAKLLDSMRQPTITTPGSRTASYVSDQQSRQQANAHGGAEEAKRIIDFAIGLGYEKLVDDVITSIDSIKNDASDKAPEQFRLASLALWSSVDLSFGNVDRAKAIQLQTLRREVDEYIKGSLEGIIISTRMDLDTYDNFLAIMKGKGKEIVGMPWSGFSNLEEASSRFITGVAKTYYGMDDGERLYYKMREILKGLYGGSQAAGVAEPVHSRNAPPIIIDFKVKR